MPDLDENGFVALDATNRAQAIVDCHLCDDDGYFGAQPCNHVDYAPIAKRGMELVRKALEGRRDA